MPFRGHSAVGCRANWRVVSATQLDIETGKTVAEWGFQKDGTDVAMKDLINDTKGVRRQQTTPRCRSCRRSVMRESADVV